MLRFTEAFNTQVNPMNPGGRVALHRQDHVLTTSNSRLAIERVISRNSDSLATGVENNVLPAIEFLWI